MKKENGTQKNIARLYFAVLTVISITLCFAALSISFSVKNKALEISENNYHTLNHVFADYCDKEVKSGELSIDFAQDAGSIVLYVDADGDVTDYCNAQDSSFKINNIKKYLSTAKMSNPSYDEACEYIFGGKQGRFELFFSNQTKILIYTPVPDSDKVVVRIMARKTFEGNKKLFGSNINYTVILILVFIVFAFLLMYQLTIYTQRIEDANARHDLMAADNDLISFTYHSSIASFEMTGAVENVFGAETAKRGQIDWGTLSQKLHPDDQSLLRNISKAIKVGDTKYTTEFRMVDTKGEYHWYRLNGKSILGGNDEVTKFVGTIQNSDDQISHENMLKDKAEHDLLTGLLNKITIQETVDRVVQSLTHSVYAFYIIDLDNFKAVNDNLGHATGDKVLTDVASKLQLVFNEADYIGRLGGDEFAVLLVIPSMMTSQANKLICEKAKQLNEILRAEYGDGSLIIRVSASIGISIYPSDGIDFNTLYQHADRALYHSKENGKDRFSFYTDVE